MSEIGSCERCNAPCRINTVTNADARLLKHAKAPTGLCANCAVTEFLQGLEVLKWASGIGPQALLNPMIRLQFASIMAAGCADMRPEEIHWETVVKNWDLPFKRKKRQC